jgi:hypothetical protein
LDSIAAQQEEATGLWDELVAGETFGQSFVCTRDNLYRVDLGTATYARTNSASVIFHLQESPRASTDIISVTISGPEIQNDRPTSITFPPLSNSQNQSYYFYIESPQAVTGDAITVYANEHDQYPEGTAYRNGQPVAGDLIFSAYSQEKYTFAGVWGDFMSRVQEDIPFFTCYGVLLLFVTTSLVIVWHWKPMKYQSEQEEGKPK